MTLFIFIGGTIFILDRIVKVKRFNNFIIISFIFILLFLVHLVLNSKKISYLPLLEDQTMIFTKVICLGIWKD